MKAALLVFSLLTPLLLPCTAREDRGPEAPKDFLRTDSAAWQQILATEITADFQRTPIREVCDVIAHKARANMTVRLAPVAGVPAPAPPVAEPAPPAANVGAVPGSPTIPIPGLPHPEPEPLITAHFDRTPLRVVLYRLSRDTHLVVDWSYLPENPHNPQAISIHSK
jgi:hypothetical protein